MGCGVSSTGRGGNALAITVVPSKPKENNGVAKGPPTVRAEPMVLPPSVAIHATPVDHPRRIIICGAPASGKGTQCELIKAKFGVIHISTGDLLRNAVHSHSELGSKVKEYMEAGKLVPDDLVISLVQEEIELPQCQSHGWLLDGFPRTRQQAIAMRDAGIVADYFLLLHVPDELLIRRVVGRRMDPLTGKIYHIEFNPAPNFQIMERLCTRGDDTEDKARVRLATYHQNVDSVKDLYTDVVYHFDGTLDKQTIFAQIDAVLDPQDLKSNAVPAKSRPLHVVVAGAPASGKGTLCELLKERYGMVHISTGDVLRASAKAGHPLGLEAQTYMNSGALVPDSVMIPVVKEYLTSKECEEGGWLLDGFPRTGAQAKALVDAGLIVDAFILIDVPEETLVERVEGRRMDPVTGKIYNLKFSPPESEEIAARLVQRPDDTVERVRARERCALSVSGSS